MKVDFIDLIQHVNVAFMLGFCVLYPLFHFGYIDGLGLVIWAFSLPFTYFPNIMIIPGVSEEEKLAAKRASIVAGWSFILFWWGLLVESSLLVVSGALLILLAAYCIFYIRRLRKIHRVRTA